MVVGRLGGSARPGPARLGDSLKRRPLFVPPATAYGIGRFKDFRFAPRVGCRRQSLKHGDPPCLNRARQRHQEEVGGLGYRSSTPNNPVTRFPRLGRRNRGGTAFLGLDVAWRRADYLRRNRPHFHDVDVRPRTPTSALRSRVRDGLRVVSQLRLSQWHVAVRRCRICLVRDCTSALFRHLSLGTLERQGLTATPSNMYPKGLGPLT